MLILTAELFQSVAGGDLGKSALRRLAIEPGEETRQCRAVAVMRCTRAVDFGSVLARLRQHTWIGGAMDLRSRFCEPVEDPGGGGGRIGLYSASFGREVIERWSQLLGRHNGDRVAEMAFEAGDQLAPVDEQADRAVLPQDRK